jgi:hypothetical protein
MTPRRIDVHIESLVLDGVAAANPEAVGAVVRRELARLLADSPDISSLMSGLSRPALDGGAFTVPAGATAETIGAALARSLHHGLVGRGGEE